jgi:hypothetical protein
LQDLISLLEKMPLPSWLIAFLAAVLLAISLWPKVHELLNDIFPSQREFRREKQKLELLKLMYEVETIKKQHDLGELASRLPQSLQSGEIAREIQSVTASTKTKPISLVQRLLFGFLGSAVLQTPLVLLLTRQGGPPAPGDVISLVLLAGLGAGASWLLGSTSIAWSLLHGMTPTFLLIVVALLSAI